MNSKLDRIDSQLDTIIVGQADLAEGQRDLAERFEAGLANLAEKVEESGERIVSEVHSLRSDLGARDDRLGRIEGDVSEIKARMQD